MEWQLFHKNHPMRKLMSWFHLKQHIVRQICRLVDFCSQLELKCFEGCRVKRLICALVYCIILVSYFVQCYFLLFMTFFSLWVFSRLVFFLNTLSSHILFRNYSLFSLEI